MGWLCEQRFDSAFHAECRLEDQTKSVPPPEIAPTATGPTQASQYRYIPVAMRPSEQVIAFAIWRVPLYGIPTNRTDAEFLLHSVLCGRALRCTVRYEIGTRELAQRTPHPFIR